MTQSPDNNLTITIQSASTPIWNIMLAQTIPDDLPLDHLLHLTFRARSSTRNPIRIVIEHTTAPYIAAGQATPTLTPDWQTYKIDGNSPGFGPAGLAVKFQLGQQAGTIDLADIHFTDAGPDPAIAAAKAAIQPEKIADRINRYRKRQLDLHVTDATGKPLSAVTVELTQTRHAFLFGCNLFGLDPKNTDPLQQQYQSRFAALLNYATLPFYWGSYEPKKGETHEAKLLAMVEWAHSHHITCKGHPLVYQIVYPSWAPKDAASTIPLLHARETDIIRRFDGLINIWDVINEANSAGFYSKTGVGDWVNRDGAAHVVADVLHCAREANPGRSETFLYNDYDRSPNYVALLNALKARDQLPDAIGMQSHMHDKEWTPESIWIAAENLAQFSKPIHFTETTVLSGDHRPIPNAPGPNATDWSTTPEGEAKQAEYVVQFYSILFSHPSLRAITWWDFSDNDAWLGAPAGLLRKDMTPKPAYDALMKLIHHDWWTNTTLMSDSAGKCGARVFCGDYDLIIKNKQDTSTQKQIQIPLPELGTDDSPVEITVRL